MDPELGEHPLGMMAHSVRAQGQTLTDITIGQALGQEERDLRLPPGEPMAVHELRERREFGGALLKPQSAAKEAKIAAAGEARPMKS